MKKIDPKKLLTINIRLHQGIQIIRGIGLTTVFIGVFFLPGCLLGVPATNTSQYDEVAATGYFLKPGISLILIGSLLSVFSYVLEVILKYWNKKNNKSLHGPAGAGS